MPTVVYRDWYSRHALWCGHICRTSELCDCYLIKNEGATYEQIAMSGPYFDTKCTIPTSTS